LVEEAAVCLSCLAGESQDAADSRLTSLLCTNAFLPYPIDEDDMGYFVEPPQEDPEGRNLHVQDRLPRRLYWQRRHSCARRQQQHEWCCSAEKQLPR
jgi:hypothetical protein